MISLIASVDENLGIGYNGDLLIHISEDLKRFKRITMGKIIIMGYKTAMSLPGSKPLPGRQNIVVTKNHEKDLPKGFEAVNNTRYILDRYEYSGNEVLVIGGASMYDLFMPFARNIYLTKVFKKFENVDTYFPKINGAERWYATNKSEIFHDSKNNVDYQFIDFDSRREEIYQYAAQTHR